MFDWLSLFVARCLLIVDHCLLIAVRWLLFVFVVCCWLVVGRRSSSLLVVHCLLVMIVVVCCSLYNVVVRCLAFVVRCAWVLVV